MSFDDSNLFVTMLNDQALFFQGVFALNESGQLESETYLAYLAWFAANVDTPGGQAWWEGIGRPIYTPRMVAEVEKRVAEGGLPDVLQMHWIRVEDLPPPTARNSDPSA